MPSPLTKEHLDASLQDLVRHFTRSLATLADRSDRRFDGLDQQLREARVKLDAVMSGEVLVTRKQLTRLLERLRSRGIDLSEQEIFGA
jgi:hypothetical protein